MDNNPQKMVTRYALILFSLLSIAIIYTYFNALPHVEAPLSSTVFKPTAQTIAHNIVPLSTAAQNTTMKSDDYKIPIKQQKLTELLPEELKRNIKASLLSPEQLQELSAEERFQYKQTQKKLAKVLREIGKTEAENQKLQGYLNR